MSSGGNSGVTNGIQLSFENQEAQNIAAENEKKVQERLDYLKYELPKTSPMPVPHNATIKSEYKKNGYEHVSYKWSDGEYNYESRWHTHTPGAPEYSQETWVVERIRPGIGAGKNARPRIHEYLIKGQGWVSDALWNKAKGARKKGRENKEQRELLDNGHWNAKK